MTLREDVCSVTQTPCLREGHVCYLLLASDVQFPFSRVCAHSPEGVLTSHMYSLLHLRTFFFLFLFFFTGPRAEGLVPLECDPPRG